MSGTLVISLDFELHWGVRDKMTVADYRENLLGERIAVEALLDVFRHRGIHATWATVGALFCADKEELRRNLPRRLPRYHDVTLSPYEALEQEIGADERTDPYHFAPTLVQKIAETPDQELATHTFGHFYCQEAGQTAEDFDADLEAAAHVGARFGDVTRTIVFPRNQYNPAYRPVMRARGVRAYRSNGTHWAYLAAPSREPRRRRAFRLADAYLPLSGHNTSRPAKDGFGLVDVSASAFLRPYHPKARLLDRARAARLKRSMTFAATRDECFHLWWHPHNFGRHLAENLHFLNGLLDHFDDLRTRYGMRSASMVEVAASL